MKIIQKLVDLIDDKIHDVENYAKLAIEVKATNPGLAQVFYNISAQEEQHQAMLHSEVVKLIENHRKTKGEPPAAMMAIYDHEHKKYIKHLAEARRYQEIYKNT